MKLERCLAETLIYHSSILSLFEGADAVCLSDEILKELTGILSTKPIPEAPQWANSPLLGGFPTLFRLILDITKLRSDPHKAQYAAPLAQRLDEVDQLIEARVLTAWDEKRKSNCCNEVRMFSTATKILLLKFMYPQCGMGDPLIEGVVQEGVQRIRVWSPDDRFDQFFCWPLLVIGCGLQAADDIELLRTKLDEIWDTTHCGDARRVRATLESVWAQEQDPSFRDGTTEVSTTRKCGLDILLRNDGVFGLLRT